LDYAKFLSLALQTFFFLQFYTIIISIKLKSLDMSKYTKNYTKLAEFGRELLDKKSFVDGLPHISKYAKEIIQAQRCSIFMYNSSKNKLWTTLADDVERIIIDSDTGIVGETLRLKKPILENDVYSNPHFLASVDKSTGFKTTSIITAPIFNSQKEIQGILQLLNKQGGFNNDDTKFMIFFAHYISGFLELINLYEESEEN